MSEKPKVERSAVPDLVLEGAKRRLRESRTRWRMRVVFQGAVWSLTAVVLVVALLDAYVVVAVHFDYLPLISASTIVGAALSCLLLGCLAASAWAASRDPDLLEVARWADRRFGLDDRLHTALEVHASGNGSVLARALLADASDHAIRVVPRLLVPFSVSLAGWFIAASVLLAVMLYVVTPLSVNSRTNAGERVEGVAASEPSNAQAKIRRVAELIAANAATTNDPRLLSIASSLEELSEAIEAGELSSEAGEQELARLLAYAGLEYGLTLGEAAEVPDRTGRSIGEPREASGFGDGSARPSQNPMEGPESLALEEGQLPTGAAAPPAPAEERLTLDLLLERLEQDFALNDGAPPNVTADEVNFRAGEGEVSQLDWEDEAATELILENLRRMRAESPGAGGAIADRQGTGGTDGLAGVGTQPLNQGVETGLDLGQFELSPVEVALPSSEASGGRRIRIEVPPEARATAVTDAQDTGGGWELQSEYSSVSERVGVRQREAVGRYFLPASAKALEVTP